MWCVGESLRSISTSLSAATELEQPPGWPTRDILCPLNSSLLDPSLSFNHDESDDFITLQKIVRKCFPPFNSTINLPLTELELTFLIMQKSYLQNHFARILFFQRKQNSFQKQEKTEKWWIEDSKENESLWSIGWISCFFRCHIKNGKAQPRELDSCRKYRTSWGEFNSTFAQFLTISPPSFFANVYRITESPWSRATIQSAHDNTSACMRTVTKFRSIKPGLDLGLVLDLLKDDLALDPLARWRRLRTSRGDLRRVFRRSLALPSLLY